MAEKSIPYCWVGQTVAVGLCPSYGSIRVAVLVGVLHDVNELGIVASLESEPYSNDWKEKDRSFYPWSAILEIYAHPPRPRGGRRKQDVADIARKIERVA